METQPEIDEAAMLAELEENGAPEEPPTETPKKKAPPKKSASTKKAPAKKGKFLMWEWLQAVIDYNTALIFADTGAGKTKACEQIAYECAKEGKKVKYIDHEANFSRSDKEILKEAGVTYQLIPNWRKLYNLKKDDIKGYDLVIVDSATLAITGKWASLDMHSKGSILQQLQGMVYRLSEECITKRETIVLLTAQPISTMGDRNALAPVGDKVMFMCKEIFYIYAPRDEEGKISKRIIKAFRSRNFQDGTIISTIKTQKFGVEFDKKHMTDLLADL